MIITDYYHYNVEDFTFLQNTNKGRRFLIKNCRVIDKGDII